MIMAASALESGPQLRPGSPHSPSIIVENIITNIIEVSIIVVIIITNIIVAKIIVYIIKPYLCKHYEQQLPNSPTIIILNIVITIFNQVLLVILIMMVMMFQMVVRGDDYKHSSDCGNRRCEQSHSYNNNFYLFMAFNRKYFALHYLPPASYLHLHP